MIRILDTVDKGYQPYVEMWVDLNFDQYDLCRDPTAGPFDIVLWHWSNNRYCDIVKYDAKIKLVIDVFHGSEDKVKGHISTMSDLSQPFEHDYVVIECLDPTISHPKLLFSDFLFNRTKAYYSQRAFRPGIEKWYHTSSLDFVLPELDARTYKSRIFLSPGKVARSGLTYRPQIQAHMNKHRGFGHIGHWVCDGNLWQGAGLCPNHVQPQIRTVEEIVKIQQNQNPVTAYNPVHNAYYNDTFISIYGETFEWGSSIMITEKTWDPLIKGHFILPFSTPGFIDHLKQKGFLFPTFIDYSYDNIADNDSRFKAYTEEIDRLMNIDIAKWRQLWIDNIDILWYNRSMFDRTPYHRINFEKLLQEIT